MQFLCAAMATAALAGVHGSDVLRDRLDNGLTLLMAPNCAAPVVALQAWVGVGSADEVEGEYGIAHVFEHMLFKGTARRGVGEIAQDVEGAGGEINAWTTFDQTVYHVVVASRDFDVGLDVMSDALQHSSFDPAELELEREVILEEIKQGADDPGRSVAQALFSTAYVRHPYGRPVIGTDASVRALSRERLLEFFRTWYVANNVTLVVAGDFDPGGVRAAVRRAFGDLPGRALPRRRVREPAQTRPRAAVVTQDVREAQIAVGFHIPALRSEDTAALDVLAVVLGQGESSRLTARVRRARELATSAYAYAHSLRDPGLFVVGMTVPPTTIGAALDEALVQVFRLAIEPIGDAEIDKARRVIEADAIYQEETAQGAARKLGFYERVAGRAEFEREYLDRVARTTASDVRAAAARYLRPDNATVAALLPSGGRLATARGRDARRARLIAAVGKAAARAAKSYAPPAPIAFASGVVRDVLPNGLRVIVRRDATVPIVAMRAVWLGGVRAETARNNGINYLLAALITRGCGELSAEQLAARVDDMAGVLSGFSGRNTFGLRAEWLAADWEAGLGLLADCIRAPALPHAEFLRERRRLLDEIAARSDSPSYVAFRLLQAELFRGHPYRFDVLGDEASVAKLSRKQLVDYYRNRYPVGDMVLVVVGDVDPERVLRRVRELFGDAPRRRLRGPARAAAGAAPSSGGPREVYGYLDRQQAHMVVGFPGTTVDDPDRYALDVLTTILSGQGGRLFVELRDRRGLAYRVGATSFEGVDPGYVAIYIACSPQKIEQAYEAIRSELRRIVHDKVSDDELRRAQRYLVGAHEIALQRRSAIASAMAFHEVYGLGVDEYARYAAAIDAVTPEDVQRVAATYLDWDAAVVATVRPPAFTPEAARRARGVVSKRRPARGPRRGRRGR
ncbi:MAG: insulinase family protein [Deltaproteobacteria bacterium]|nr:MAG: insulinase family protein [Deltaproteobacteria bacterium]